MTASRWLALLIVLLFGLAFGTALTSAEPNSPAATLPKEISCNIGHGVKMEFVLIRPGTFTMGADGHDGAAHQVTLTKQYYIGKYEVTQEQWKEVTGANQIPLERLQH